MLQEKLDAWIKASELIKPIIDEHTLEVYKSGAIPFGPSSTVTKVDQHIDHNMRVADWLLGLDN